MSNQIFKRAECFFVNDRLYAVKLIYAPGVERYHFAPAIPAWLVSWVRERSPEMPEQSFESASTFNVETDCPYHDCYMFGGCPPECDCKRFCPDYDGEALQ